MPNGIGITSGVESWAFQGNYVERPMDNAAYTVAHPDDTLLLAGPARKGSLLASDGSFIPRKTGISSLLAIGGVQSMQFSQSRPTQPMMAIGSGRSFYVSGKAQTQWSMSRLFLNGRNLLRVLHHNAVAAGVDVSKLDDPAGATANANFFANLDSELYYVPFGIGAFIRNKAHDHIASFYSELCMISSWSVGFNAGQAVVLESVMGMADRLLPLDWSEVAGAKAANRRTLDEVLDFVSPSPGMPGPNATTMTDELP